MGRSLMGLRRVTVLLTLLMALGVAVAPRPARADRKTKKLLETIDWAGDADASASSARCPFDPERRGRLISAEGSATGANHSAGMARFALLLDDQLVLAFTQNGELEGGGGNTFANGEVWQVSCARSGVAITAGNVKVSLRYADGSFAVDPRSFNGLEPGAHSPADDALPLLDGVLAALASSDRLPKDVRLENLDEAQARVSLLRAERALAVPNTDAAGHALPTDKLAQWPALEAWRARLDQRLRKLRSDAPLRATNVRRVGSLTAVPALPLAADEPDLFWRGAELCVRGQDAATRAGMRCLAAAGGGWRPREPYRSPFAGWTVQMEHLGNPGGYQTLVQSVGPAGRQIDHGEYDSPELLARGANGALVVLDATESGEFTVGCCRDKYDAAAGCGSLLARDGSYYFRDGATLRSSTAPRSWSFSLGPAGAPTCATAPLVSPDQRWAACAAKSAQADPSSALPYHLYLFALVPADRGAPAR